MNKIKNLSMKNKILLILILLIELLLVGGTLAWLVYESDNNALVNAKVCAPEIVFLGGSTINGSGLRPVADKENGLSKNISVNLENLCDNDTAVLNLNMTLESFPSSLSDSSFKWVLYGVTSQEVNEEIVETETFVNSGNFANKAQNDTITLAEDLIVTSNVSTYRLYIWIDGTMDNPSSMGGNAFRFKLYGTGTGAIYNQYTMARKSNSSATEAFWGSPIKANQVKSIRFVKASEVPNQYTGTYDVSSVANSQDVTMYYVENGATEDATPITLYDVYVASNNGASKIKTNTSAANMFAYLTNCEYIDAEGLDTSNATSMARMFYSCSNLINLDLSNFNTSKVTDMAQMFYNCSSLTSLDLSSFDTSSVTDMYEMFHGCQFTSLDLSGFNTSKVTNIEGLFKRCSNLRSLDLSNFDVSNVTNAVYMFYGCTSLEYLNVSNFSNYKIKSLSFSGLTKLKTIVLNNFNTSNFTSMASMFSGCSSLTSLDLSSFNTSNVTSMASMFSGCSSLTSLDLSDWSNDKVTTINNMFYNCSGLKTLNLTDFGTSAVKNMSQVFYQCTGLESLDLSSFITSSVTNMYEMFHGCNFTSLNLSNFNTSSLENIRGTFKKCKKLVYLDISNFDFTNISIYNDVFTNDLSSLEIIVKDCEQYNLFTSKIGTRSGLHTISGDYSCTV